MRYCNDVRTPEYDADNSWMDCLEAYPGLTMEY